MFLKESSEVRDAGCSINLKFLRFYFHAGVKVLFQLSCVLFSWMVHGASWSSRISHVSPYSSETGTTSQVL
jgi:hypothetical protein